MPRTEPDRIPRPLLLGVGALVLTTLLGVTAMRVAGVAPVAQPPSLAAAQSRVLVQIVELEGGGIDLRDPATGAVTASLGVGEDGFVRGVLRALTHRRSVSGVAEDGPVELISFPGGHIALLDPSTGWRADLTGFGADNLATFATLMSDMTDREEDAL